MTLPVDIVVLPIKLATNSLCKVAGKALSSGGCSTKLVEGETLYFELKAGVITDITAEALSQKKMNEYYVLKNGAEIQG